MRVVFFMKILFTLSLVAKPLAIGDLFPNYQILNQFDKRVSFGKNLKLIVIGYDKKSTAIFNEILKNTPTSHPYNFIIDVSGAPQPVIDLFIKPGMQNYQHNILMSKERDFNLDLPYLDDDSLAFVVLQDGKIEDIQFASQEGKIRELVNQYLVN